MEKAAIIEIIAISTGIIVITIETVIIILLQKHMKALDKHVCKLEESTNMHLEHLNEHSHKIEMALEKICGPEPMINMEREHKPSPIESVQQKEPATLQLLE